MNININWNQLDAAICVKNADKSYLFSDQLQKICRLSEEFINTKNSKNRNAFKNDCKTESIIGIIGDRGSGKSSLLRTVEDNLKYKYLSLGVLDPSTFDESMTIIELFISRIFQYINCECSVEQASGFKEDLISRLKKITKILADYKVGTESFYRDFAYSEILQNLETRENMAYLINELVQEFIRYVNMFKETHYSNVALYIDDVDIVSNRKVYRLLEDIRKYLCGNVFVVVAYRSEQLFESILHEKIIENKVLLDNKVLSIEQLKEQVSRYIEKLIPVHNRVEVLNTENLLDTALWKLLKDLDTDNGGEDFLIDKTESVKNWLYKNLENKLRLKLVAVDDSENTVYNLPTNLRGILQLVRLVCEELTELDLNRFDSDGKIYYADNLLRNVKVYIRYFVNNLSVCLPTKLFNIIAKWQNRECKAKNYFMCSAVIDLMSEIYGGYEKLKSENGSVLKFNSYQIYNITLGDVHRVLDEYKNIDTSIEGRFFVYVIKVLYSFELLSQYLLALKTATENEISNQYLTNYLVLINARIIYEGFTYASGAEKAMVIKYIVNYNEDKETNMLYKYLLFTDIANSGDIRRAIEGKKLEISPFYYRPIVNYDLYQKNSALVNGTKYPIDPFAFVGQKWYVEESFISCLDEDKRKYVFYSMFDIDVFIRLNYNIKTKEPNEVLKKIFDKINKVLKNDTNGSKYFEVNLFKKLSNSIFKLQGGDNSIFGDVYGQDLINETDKLKFSSYNTDAAVKDINKQKAMELLKMIIGHEDVRSSETNIAKECIETLKQPRKQATNYIKNFIRETCNRLDIEIYPEDDSENGNE